MSAHLDIDDAVDPHPLAKWQVADLRESIDQHRRTITSLMAGMPEDGTTPVIRRIAALEVEIDGLRRWKSTHAPRLAAIEGLLHAAQHEAAAGREAIATLASERAANALLTAEVEGLRGLLERTPLTDEQRAVGTKQCWGAPC